MGSLEVVFSMYHLLLSLASTQEPARSLLRQYVQGRMHHIKAQSEGIPEHGVAVQCLLREGNEASALKGNRQELTKASQSGHRRVGKMS